MNRETVSMSINNIDSRFITEADSFKQKKASLRPAIWVSMAACLALALICTAVLHRTPTLPENLPATADTTEEETSLPPKEYPVKGSSSTACYWFPYRTPQELYDADSADAFVLGEVIKTTPFHNRELSTVAGLIITEVTLKVTDVFKDTEHDVGETFVFYEMGGFVGPEVIKEIQKTLPDFALDSPDGYYEEFDGYRTCTVGDKIAVFLNKTTNSSDEKLFGFLEGQKYFVIALQSKFTLYNGEYINSNHFIELIKTLGSYENILESFGSHKIS